MLKTMSATLVLPILVFGQATTAKEKPKQPVLPSWTQYISDIRSELSQSRGGLAIDPSLWDRYDGVNIQWTGTFSSCSTAQKLSCTLEMQPQSIEVTSGALSGQKLVIASVGVFPIESEADRWKALAPKSKITFKAKTPATWGLVRDKEGHPTVIIPMTDGKLIP